MLIRSLSVGASLVVVAASALTGCSGLSPSNQSGQLNVVATTTQVADFTKVVGGDRIDLTALLSPGASAHAFEPTPADMAALAGADVLVVNGLGLETFVDSAVETSGFSGTVIDASSGIHWDEGGDASKAEEAAHPEGDAHAEGDTHSGEETVGEGDAHAHDGENPHIWTSPVMAAEMVHAIAEGLAEAVPEDASYFEANAEAYEAQLVELDAWIAENVALVPEADRQFVSGHNSLDYYLQRYDIDFVGSILPSFEDNAEPSVAEISALIDNIRASGVDAIFVESSLNPKIADQIARDSGARLVSEDVIYADSLGTSGSGAETYITATIHNTNTILKAWGYTPLPLPSALQ